MEMNENETWFTAGWIIFIQRVADVFVAMICAGQALNDFELSTNVRWMSSQLDTESNQIYIVDLNTSCSLWH